MPINFKVSLDPASNLPIFQQLVDQIHFAINTGELKPGDKLPSIRVLASENDIAVNTVAKALRHLEFRGLVSARDRSGFVVSSRSEGSRYQARGVSADKTEVHRVVDRLDEGLFPHAFCKVTEDYLGGDPDKCNIIHSDGSGTKSIIAYLYYKETGDASVFRGIAQDSIVMNLDDLICVGVNGRILLSNTLNRNAINCPGEVVSALIEGSESFMATLRDQGVEIWPGGGETADVGDLTGTILVDSCAVAILKKQSIIPNEITGNLAIVGLSSTGQTGYETSPNSGIGSNGLTSARHDLLCDYYARKYPESFDSNLDSKLAYCGPYRLEDPLPDGHMSVGEALLSPTRTYAPLVYRLMSEMRSAVKGLVHCSGGAQTKCLRFGSGIHYIKNNLFPVPPVFRCIQEVSHTDWKEMYKVFNMGHRLEIYVDPAHTREVIDLAASFNIEAREIGYTEQAAGGRNQLTLTDPSGQCFDYQRAI